jgi:RNA polymerase sigma factor (sigma-70 family)
MAIEQNSSVLRYIRAIFSEGAVADLTDHQLLERFTDRAGPDDSAELAFVALVERHGPMVLRVCRAALRDEHDAQDAFQAVFLVLVQKARSLRVRDSLGPWLHAVALRVSTHARVLAMKKRVHERKNAEMSTRSDGETAGVPDELNVAIHEEVGQLPEGFRKAVVLCDLEGLTHEEAARRLGWPVGTVKSRQARARERLRGRLIRRGLAPLSGGIAAALSTSTARAAISKSLLTSTAKTAVLVARGSATAGTISALTLAWKQGVLRAMWMTRLRIAAGPIVFVGTVVTAAGLAIYAGGPAGLLQTPQAGRALGPRARPEAPRTTLDKLRSEDIPANKRLNGQPKNVVAVLGEMRGRHAGEVRGLALSRDGKLLATVADQDHRIRLWDAQTLQPLDALAGHRAFVNCVALSPDGHWLASGGAYGDFFLWDMRLTPPKGPTLLPTHGAVEEFNNMIHATAFSPDGTTLAVAGDARSVDLFDMSGTQPVDRGALPGIVSQVRSLRFSPDGTILALAGLEDGTARLWDLTGTAPLEKVVLKPTEDADVAALPPVQLGNGPVQAMPNPRLIAGQRHGMISIAFSPDGKNLAALEQDGDVRLWDLSRSEPANEFRLKVAPGQQDRPGKRPGGAMYGLRDLAMVTFSPDGGTLAAAQPRGWIRLWALKDGKATKRAAFPAHEGPVTGVLSFGPDGMMLYSGGGDHLVRTWDLTPAEPREKLEPKGPIGGLGSVAFSPDATKLAVIDAEFVRIWDLSDTQNLSCLPAPKIKIDVGPTGSLTFSPSGKVLICGGDLNTSPSMWDVSGLEPTRLGDLHSPAFLGIRSISFSSDGETLAAGYNDHKVRVWDMRGPEPKERLELDGGERSFAAAAISPNGAHLAFGGPGYSMRLWVLAGLEPRERAVMQGTGWPVSSVAFSPNGKIVAAGTNGGTQLWDISGGRPRALHPTRNFIGFATALPINDCLGFSMVFSSDGKRLIAADQISDKAGKLPSRPAVCVYDVVSGDRLHEWDLSAPCRAIALAPDGRHVAAAQQDGVTLILRLPDGPVR